MAQRPDLILSSDSTMLTQQQLKELGVARVGFASGKCPTRKARAKKWWLPIEEIRKVVFHGEDTGKVVALQPEGLSGVQCEYYYHGVLDLCLLRADGSRIKPKRAKSRPAKQRKRVPMPQSDSSREVNLYPDTEVLPALLEAGATGYLFAESVLENDPDNSYSIHKLEAVHVLGVSVLEDQSAWVFVQLDFQPDEYPPTQRRTGWCKFYKENPSEALRITVNPFAPTPEEAAARSARRKRQLEDTVKLAAKLWSGWLHHHLGRPVPLSPHHILEMQLLLISASLSSDNNEEAIKDFRSAVKSATDLMEVWLKDHK